jgi:ClpX C4-type zinc finger
VTVTRCDFCGKSQDDVRVIVTRNDHAICDECVSLAFDTISRRSRQHLYFRVAYWLFVAVASVGYFVTRPLRSFSTGRR